MVGISTRGQDAVRDDLNCEDFATTTVADVTDDLLPQNTTCVVVDGKLILFFENQQTKNQIDWSGTVVTQLKNQMANGRFLSANEAIRRREHDRFGDGSTLRNTHTHHGKSDVRTVCDSDYFFNLEKCHG